MRRGEQVYAVLNLYPYGGHLMVVPYRHVAGLHRPDPPGDRRARRADQQAMTSALRTASGAHGFNIGMNQGTVAGAGIAAHSTSTSFPARRRHQLHAGRRPRKVLPQLLADTRKMLAEAWPTP